MAFIYLFVYFKFSLHKWADLFSSPFISQMAQIRLPKEERGGFECRECVT